MPNRVPVATDLAGYAIYVGLLVFALLTVLTGSPTRAARVVASAFTLLITTLRLMVVAAVNTLTLTLRLFAPFTGEHRANAWATYVERMTDLFAIHTWRRRP